MKTFVLLVGGLTVALGWFGAERVHAAGESKRKIAFIAGLPSHGYAQHEYNAGCLLLGKCLSRGMPGVECVFYNGGWPKDPQALDRASAIVIFSDGLAGHPVLRHLDQLDKLMRRGAGLVCLHDAVGVPKGKPGDRLKYWLGGCCETSWPANPFWTAEFRSLPVHPITRGVRPFALRDEWHFHLQFVDKMEGVTPILTARPPASAREGRDGEHSGHPTVRAEKGKAEVLAWARLRPDGGRGFGFTGGDCHWNWANDSYRTLVLNGIAWTAKLDVPPGGVPSKTPTLEELEANQDKPRPPKFDRDKVRRMIEGWKPGRITAVPASPGAG
jgi:hypothetical protein